MSREIVIEPGLRSGRVTAPPSKSHAHRLMIANFLAGGIDGLESVSAVGEDIAATRRCLEALSGDDPNPVLDCGESGSTLRFLSPVAAALGKRPSFIRRGRLAERPFRSYEVLSAGVFELPGNVSSQFATGLLFALPLIPGESRIRFTSPLESRGYVELTLRVLDKAGISVIREPDGFRIQGGQRYRMQDGQVEGDWSGAAAWLAMNAIGSDIAVDGLDGESAQPDRIAAEWLRDLPKTIDVSQSPDLFPVVSAAAAAMPRETAFVGIRRLRLKECDRVEAMRQVLSLFGVEVRVSDDGFTVKGTDLPLKGGRFPTFSDHRIAMAIAVGASRASSSVVIDDASCVAKSYPGFFEIMHSL